MILVEVGNSTFTNSPLRASHEPEFKKTLPFPEDSNSPGSHPGQSEGKGFGSPWVFSQVFKIRL